MKKGVKSKVAAQKWLRWSDNGKICNNNNSGELVGSQLFQAAFFYMGCTFFTVWLFLCRSHFFLQLTNFCFVASGWTAYWMTWLQMNCIPSDFALAELYTRWLRSGWTVYRVTRLWLSYIVCDLALAEQYTEWHGSGWTVYWVIRLWLNCVLGDWLWLSCILGE